VLLIPSFAVGRAQALQYLLAMLKHEGHIPNIPVFLDSPMAISVSDIYCRYSQHHRLNHEQCNLYAGLGYTLLNPVACDASGIQVTPSSS